MDGRRGAGADLRAEVVQRGEGRFSAGLFHERRALNDGYWLRSRLNEGRGAPAVTGAFGVPSSKRPPAGAEVGHLRRAAAPQNFCSARGSCSAAAALRSQPCVRGPQRCARGRRFARCSLKAATCCSLLQSCGAAAVPSCRSCSGQMRVLAALTVSKALRTQRLGRRFADCHATANYCAGEQRSNGSLRGVHRPDGIRILRAQCRNQRTLASSSRQLEQSSSRRTRRAPSPFRD